MKYIITLEVEPGENGKHPKDWFWTDACSTPDDDVSITEIINEDGEKEPTY